MIRSSPVRVKRKGGELDEFDVRQPQRVLQCSSPADSSYSSVFLPYFSSSPSSSSASSSVSSWSAIPASLLSAVCQYLSSFLDLLFVSRVCRGYLHVMMESQTSRSCWSACSLIMVEHSETTAGYGITQFYESRDGACSEYDEEAQSAAEKSFTVSRPDQVDQAFHSLRCIPALSVRLCVSSVDVQVSILTALLRHCQHVRHLALQLVDPYKVCFVLTYHMPHLSQLISLHVSTAESQTLSTGFIGFLSPSIAERLVRLSAWRDDLLTILQHGVVFPAVVSLTISGDSTRLVPASTAEGEKLFVTFPAMRFLHLPSEWMLPNNVEESESKVWQELNHLRCNLAGQLIMESKPLMTQLRSLYLDIDCTVWGSQRQVQPCSSDQLSRVYIEEEMAAFLEAVPQLEQLTLTSTQLTVYTPDRSYDVSFKITLPTLNLLVHLTYLCLDCPKLISKKFLSDLLLPSSTLSFRPHLRHLMLVLKVNCMLRVLACFSPRAAFPALERCFMRCYFDLDEKDRYKFDLMMRGERQQEYHVLEKLMRDKVGDDVWTTETDVVGQRVDLQWQRRAGLSLSDGGSRG